MRKKIDYKPLIEKAIDNMREINRLAKEFSKFEMVENVKLEMDEILELSDVSRKEYQSLDKESFFHIMSSFTQIDDDLHEIEMITGSTIKDINELPEEKREFWYKQMGVEKIDKEDQGLSEERQELLYSMLELSAETIDADKYYSLEKEDYLDYEDEIEEE